MPTRRACPHQRGAVGVANPGPSGAPLFHTFPQSGGPRVLGRLVGGGKSLRPMARKPTPPLFFQLWPQRRRLTWADEDQRHNTN